MIATYLAIFHCPDAFRLALRPYCLSLCRGQVAVAGVAAAELLFFRHQNSARPESPCDLSVDAFACALLSLPRPNRPCGALGATRFACFDNARLDADRRLSRLSARLVARERFAEGFYGDQHPFVRSRFA